MVSKRFAKNLIKQYIEACKKRNIYFQKVILFGSVVTGRTHKYSDIDVALVSDQFTGNTIADWQLLTPVNIHYTGIEPHPFDTKYFKKGDPFIDEIKRTGIEIKI
jgi:predicted nucleotidyltransferase